MRLRGGSLPPCIGPLGKGKDSHWLFKPGTGREDSSPKVPLDLSTPLAITRRHGQAMCPGLLSLLALAQQARGELGPVLLSGSQQQRGRGWVRGCWAPSSDSPPYSKKPFQRISWQSAKLRFIHLPGVRPGMWGCWEGPKPHLNCSQFPGTPAGRPPTCLLMQDWPPPSLGNSGTLILSCGADGCSRGSGLLNQTFKSLNPW